MDEQKDKLLKTKRGDLRQQKSESELIFLIYKIANILIGKQK